MLFLRSIPKHVGGMAPVIPPVVISQSGYRFEHFSNGDQRCPLSSNHRLQQTAAALLSFATGVPVSGPFR